MVIHPPQFLPCLDLYLHHKIHEVPALCNKISHSIHIKLESGTSESARCIKRLRLTKLRILQKLMDDIVFVFKRCVTPNSTKADLSSIDDSAE